MKILVILLSGLVFTQTQKSPLLEDFIAGNKRFAAEIYKATKDQIGNGSFLINPLSLQMIVSLVLFEHEGERFRESAPLLQLPVADSQDTQLLFKEIYRNLDKTGQSNLAIANKIFFRNDIPIDEKAKQEVAKDFNADVERVNFFDKSSVDKINKWVATNTFERSSEMVSPKSFTKDVRCLLVNLQYFKGVWQKGFPSRATKSATFYINKTHHIETPLMEVTTTFKYAYNHTLRAQFIELPYQDSDMSMTLVLPDDKYGISKLEDRIDEIFYDQLYYGPKVRLLLPPFTMKSTILLDSFLKNLGIRKGFGENNDLFTGTRVYQKAILDLDEEGRPVLKGGKIQGTPPWVQIRVNLVADHPFVFYIKSQSAGIFYFGRYSTPN